MRRLVAIVVAGLVAALLTPAASASAASVSSPAACDDAGEAPFADRDRVAPVHRPAVDCLWHLGIVEGRRGADGALRFSPSAAVGRAQFAAMLHRTLGNGSRGDELTEPRRPRFADVPEGHPFDHEVHTLAHAGIVAGVDAEHFDPDGAIRRDQTAALLVAATAWSTDRELEAQGGPWFADVEGTHFADDVDAAFEFGLVDGVRRPCADQMGRFAPAGTSERQQVASVLVSALGAMEEISAGGGGGRTADPECPPPVWHPTLDAAIEFAAGRAGSVAFAAIGTDGVFAGHRADTRVPAASVLKVMFMVAYLREPDVRDRPLTADDRELLEPMIRRSDNATATRIADRVGPHAMEALAERAGMRDFAYTRPWGQTLTSARDQVAFMLEVDRYVPERHRAYALQLLTEIVPEQQWGIGEVETDGWTQHFKGGWGSGTGAVDHQVVMLRYEDGTRVALAVTTTDSPSHGYGKDTLAGVFDRLLADLP